MYLLHLHLSTFDLTDWDETRLSGASGFKHVFLSTAGSLHRALEAKSARQHCSLWRWLQEEQDEAMPKLPVDYAIVINLSDLSRHSSYVVFI